MRLGVSLGLMQPIARLGGGLLSLLNSEKLSLPANTPVGTRVQVTDGFVVSNSAADSRSNGFFAANGETHNAKPVYLNASRDWAYFYRAGLAWAEGAYPDFDPDSTADDGDEAAPWNASWPDIPTLTHPAVQELTAPSTAQGGVFVSGGTQDGIYGNSVALPSQNGKVVLALLGNDTGSDVSGAIAWQTNINNAFGIGPSAAGFAIGEISFGPLLYYSLSNVATPDLAANWKNASDDSPASITVTSVTVGELNAGVLVAGAGTSADNGVYPKGSTVFAGLPSYPNILGSPLLYYDGAQWAFDNSDYNNGGPFTKFPFGNTWGADGGTPPAPTITRNDVASEANWEVVP